MRNKNRVVCEGLDFREIHWDVVWVQTFAAPFSLLLKTHFPDPGKRTEPLSG